MTPSSIQPLESYRLAEYAVPIPCYICGVGNTYDAEFCTHCAGPMALAHQANSQNIQPRMIAVLGPSGVGKTVYLGMLIDMISRQSRKMQVFSRGAFSVTLQQTTIAALARCEFPEKTPNEPDRWNWVHCQIRLPREKHPFELIVPDMAGDAVMEEVDHPHTYRVIGSLLKKCSGVMILVDTTQVTAGEVEQDFFAQKLLGYLSELDEKAGARWARQPVALVFSKADQNEACMNDPAAYAEAHLAGLWRQCRERFPLHAVFAAGVAGACAIHDSVSEGRLQIPLRVEPRGIVEPLEWLLKHLPRR